MQLARILCGLFVVWGGLMSGAPVRAVPALEGRPVQGGMLWGRVAPGSAIRLDGQDVPVHENGVFVIGFGRDAAPDASIEYRYPDGRTETQTLTISAREFDIERVNGLPPKTVTPPPEWRERRKLETGQVRAARSELMPETYWLSGFRKPAQGRFSGFYGSQRILNGQPRSPHFGLDIAAETGTPIHAPAGGVVRLAAPDFLLEGGIVIIDHGLGVTSTLFHMNAVSVSKGDRINQGDLIGTIGATGRASGPHVDWRVNWRNVRLDPLLLLEED